MARILVEADDQRRVLLDERSVRPEHVGDAHAASQLIERVIWAVRDEDQKLDRRRRSTRRRGRERSLGAPAVRSALSRAFD